MLSDFFQWGILRGNQRTTVSWTFNPARQQTYDARAALLILPPAEAAAVADHLAAAAAAEAGASALSSAAAPNCTQSARSGLLWTSLGASDGEDVTGGPKDAGCDLGSAEGGSSSLPPITSSLEDVPKVVVQVIGQATNSALACEPAVLEMGAVRVGYPEHRTIRLVNQSGGVLRYSLDVVNEEPQGVEAAAVGVLFAPAGEGEQAGQDAWVNEPEGVVGAR